MAHIISFSTLGSGEVGGRDTQCHEVLLLDRRQGVNELALALDFEHHHPGKLGHHHEGCRLLRGLLVPPLLTDCPWSPHARARCAPPAATAAAPAIAPAPGLRSARAFSETRY